MTKSSIKETLSIQSGGGAGRPGRGRPKGSGKYGEPTKAIRFPVSLLDQVDSFVKRRGYVFPLYSNQIQAGFPSPAEDDVPFVDRSLEANNGDVVVAAINGEFTVKRLFRTKKRVELRPENSKFRPIVVTTDMDFIVWGVVKTVIHNL